MDEVVPDGDAAERELAFRTTVCGIDGSPQGLEAARQALEIGAADAAYWAVCAWDPAAAVHAGLAGFDLVEQRRDQALRRSGAPRRRFRR